MKSFTRYHNAIQFLSGLSNIRREKDYMRDKKRSDIYLLRMRYFLHLLGDPDKGMKYVHITGTAGKGSVANMIHGALVSDGKTAGLFTSPFVTTTIEKFKVGDNYISPDEFADIVEKLKPALDRAYKESPYGGPTYFEVILAIAFLYFKQKKCTWVVLEAMCGGRYDATNVIEKPDVTVITNVDYDHMEILGKTLTAIATDKAGIIKRGSAFFTTERRPHILDIFSRACHARGVKLHSILPERVLLPERSRGLAKTRPLDLARGIRGVRKVVPYLQANRDLATAVDRHIGLTEDAIEKGIQSAKMPARFEIMQKCPLVVVDGAHNPVKMRSTAENLRESTYRKLHLVIGISGNKDLPSILCEIAPYADRVYATRFEITERKCAPPHVLAVEIKHFVKRGVKISEHMDSHQALEQALASAGKDDLVLVTGSFFLAGELRKKWYSEKWILVHRKSQ